MKTYAYIDASNIIYGTRNEGWKVDFRKLFKYLKERYHCKKIYYFGGQDDKDQRQQKFYRLLERIGYNLRLKPVKIYLQENGHRVRKANCDVDLTFYAMRDINKFERVIFANSNRTAKEIKVLKSVQFNDLRSFRKTIEFHQKRR